MTDALAPHILPYWCTAHNPSYCFGVTSVTISCHSSRDFTRTAAMEADALSSALKAMHAVITDDERALGVATRMPLTDECLGRYLVARQLDVPKAHEQLIATLAWRKEIDITAITSKGLEVEAQTGKMFVHGVDRLGHPLIVMRPRLENTWDHDGNLRHLTYTLERAVQTMTNGITKWVCIVDYEGYKLSKAPPMKTSLATVKIFQNHYPERLYKMYLVNPPWVFSGFWRVVSPFIDKVTREKIQFLKGKPKHLGETLLKDFEEGELRPVFGGTSKWEFQVTEYLAAAPPALQPPVPKPTSVDEANAEEATVNQGSIEEPVGSVAAGAGEAVGAGATPETACTGAKDE